MQKKVKFLSTTLSSLYDNGVLLEMHVDIFLGYHSIYCVYQLPVLIQTVF